jgi:hypothetical protein
MKTTRHFYRWTDLEKDLKGASNIASKPPDNSLQGVQVLCVHRGKIKRPKKLQKLFHFLHTLGRIVNPKSL